MGTISNAKFGTLPERIGVAFPDRCDFRVDKLDDLFRCAADELTRHQDRFKIDFGERRVRFEAVEKLRRDADALLDAFGDGVAMFAHYVVNVLAVRPRRHGGHHDVLRRHIREELAHGFGHDRLIHGEASRAEAEALAEEGVAVAPLLVPFIPPEAKN